MELDELKDIWKTQQDNFHRRDENQLSLILQGTSQSTVEKLKKSVKFELIFTLVAGLGFLIYASWLQAGALKWISLSILSSFVGYGIYYAKKLSVLNQFKPDKNLKDNLEKLVATLSSYLRFYKTSYYILYPVYFGLGLTYGALETGTEQFAEKVKDPEWIFLISALAISFFILSMMFGNWYIRRLYGNHLDKLKSSLFELNKIAEDRSSV